MSLKVGVVGSTGMVGEEFLKLLTETHFPMEELKPFASPASQGKKLSCQNKDWECQILTEGCFDGLDLVFFSSGDEISREWAPKAVASGAFAIDNSAAFRMSPDHKLIVPEVNGDSLPSKDKPEVIANPNCSTIQLVVALQALKPFGISKVNVSTYQSVSGGGKEAKEELTQQMGRFNAENPSTESKAFPHNIAYNCLPQIGSFNDKGFCSEEMKIMNESRKILGLENLNITAFTVRVPTLNCHGEAAWVSLEQNISRSDILKAFEEQEGLEVIDDISTSEFPHFHQATGKNPVYVGRIHQDLYNPETWMFWVVADNIRKGAALNGLQIAEKIFL